MDGGKIAKFVKVFSLESFPLYGIRLTLLRWCVPGRKTSVVLEWREWLELTANWERVRHGFPVQGSVELAVM